MYVRRDSKKEEKNYRDTAQIHYFTTKKFAHANEVELKT